MMQAFCDSQKVRFVVAGASAAALYFLACPLIILAGLTPFWGSLLAYGLAFVTGYSLQRSWTFKARHRHRDSLPRYLLLQLGCALLAAILADILIGRLHLSILATAIATTGAVGLTSYLGARAWVFPAATSWRNGKAMVNGQ
jgi:putative flippase GtrA